MNFKNDPDLKQLVAEAARIQTQLWDAKRAIELHMNQISPSDEFSNGLDDVINALACDGPGPVGDKEIEYLLRKTGIKEN